MAIFLKRHNKANSAYAKIARLISSVGRQKAAANAQDEERLLIKLLVIQHLANKRIEQSQKERSSSWALKKIYNNSIELGRLDER